MCIGPTTDDGCGVGASPRHTGKHVKLSEAAVAGHSIFGETLEVDEDTVVTEKLLKDKNTELAELQAMLLSVPKKGFKRKELQRRSEELDTQIKQLQKEFAHSTEVMRHAIALSDSISTNDADTIAEALSALVKMTAGLATIDDVALFYLIGAGEAVLTVMEIHTTHTGVIEYGCHALCNLFAGLKHLSGSDAITEQLCSIRTGELVLRGMAEHKTHRNIQLYGSALSISSQCPLTTTLWDATSKKV